MKEMQTQNRTAGHEEVSAPQPRKKFHGFSIGFLLILLAVILGLYMLCTFIAADSSEKKAAAQTYLEMPQQRGCA